MVAFAAKPAANYDFVLLVVSASAPADIINKTDAQYLSRHASAVRLVKISAVRLVVLIMDHELPECQEEV